MNTWKEKRGEILTRDNFTCQLCKQFNPELGIVTVCDEVDGHIELHEYRNFPDPLQSVYSISQSRTNYTFAINFGDCWPVFPIMQVHHKRYVNGKENWDYVNEDLVTLCKRCHLNLHLNEFIPIYSEGNILVEERMFFPVDTGSGRKHNCDDWTFIQKVGGGEYVVANIYPKISMVLFSHENKVDAFKEGEKAVEKLINTHFPCYSKKE